MNYKCYDLSIASEIALPELIPVGENINAEVRIAIGKVDKDGLTSGKRLGPRLWARERTLWLHVPGIARFLVCDGKEIFVDPEPGADEDSVRVFLLGSVLGAVLFQRGLLVLHGNAVRVGDGCMICVGHSGAGKSTLAAAFMRHGHRILADDVVPINARCQALPGFPRIKLWQDTADRMNIDTSGLRRIQPDVEKFNFPIFDRFVDQPLPVKWVYVLERHQQKEILFDPIQGMERFHILYQNTYRVKYLKALSLKAEHLKLCSYLSGHIRLVRLTRPEQGFNVDELVTRILGDIAEHQ